MKGLTTGLALGLVLGVTVAGGTAVAATGGTLLLGRSNTSGAQTNLANTGSGPVLSLSARSGQAPIGVSAAAGKATNLNADKLDGLDGTQLQRTVAQSCPFGFAIRRISGTGGVTCYGDVFGLEGGEVTTDSDGVASVMCDSNGISLSGSYVLPTGVAAFATGDAVFAQQDGLEGYNARFMKVDGSPYVGPLRMSVVCLYGGAPSAGTFSLQSQGEQDKRAARLK